MLLRHTYQRPGSPMRLLAPGGTERLSHTAHTLIDDVRFRCTIMKGKLPSAQKGIPGRP